MPFLKDFALKLVDILRQVLLTSGEGQVIRQPGTPQYGTGYWATCMGRQLTCYTLFTGAQIALANHQTQEQIIGQLDNACDTLSFMSSSQASGPGVLRLLHLYTQASVHCRLTQDVLQRLICWRLSKSELKALIATA